MNAHQGAAISIAARPGALHWQPAQTNACANGDHVELVEAMAAHDVDRAVTAMKCHLCNLEGKLNLRDDAPVNELATIFGLGGIAKPASSMQ